MAYGILTILVAWFVLVLLAFASPSFQQLLIYCHWVKIPVLDRGGKCIDLLNLSKLRLGHYSRNIQFQASDGALLRGWHFLPTRLGPACAAQCKISVEARERFMDAELANPEHPCILFFHGQAGTRCLYNRLEICKSLAAVMQCHVILFDYRGFGDSSGWPTESGLVKDAVAAWTWLGERRSAGAFVYGQSLGSAVAVKFAAVCAGGGDDRLQGIILDAPLASIPKAMLHHWMGLPFRIIPCVRRWLFDFIHDKWDCEHSIQEVLCPVLIFGAGTDNQVGSSGARSLHSAVLEARGRTPASKKALEARGDSAVLIVLENATHDDIYCFDEWLQALDEFIRGAFHLQPEATFTAFSSGYSSGYESTSPLLGQE